MLKESNIQLITILVIDKLKSYLLLLFVIFSLTFIAKINFFNNYTYNISSSVPKGIYKLGNIDTSLEKNQMVYIKIPDNAKDIIWNREYLPKSVDFLIKYIKGVPNDKIEVKNNKLYINNQFQGNIKKTDSEGNELPSELPQKYILKKDEYILLGSDDNSYDSRYFGIVKKNKILKKATYTGYSLKGVRK